ncbi:hypothetical protein M422DRAFT_779963 [Sphaerobolus stellatus SS14]|uniref:Uncharacterized protein n=1 Tax=Sphaerobolus stellatus (strain SS14) TaxID=990650 RepID=A0A0C9VV77_SPHS4|nr:hypothetical protein M422DRAFT_779963 [Sphaerobolus stellatus SS14]
MHTISGHTDPALMNCGGIEEFLQDPNQVDSASLPDASSEESSSEESISFSVITVAGVFSTLLHLSPEEATKRICQMLCFVLADPFNPIAWAIAKGCLEASVALNIVPYILHAPLYQDQSFVSLLISKRGICSNEHTPESANFYEDTLRLTKELHERLCVQ